MIALAALLAQGPVTPARLAALPEADLARALLTGTRPKRIVTAEGLLTWVAEETGTPPFLLAACLAATPDKAEVAALLLPPATGVPPTLAETLTTLKDRESYLSLARRLPPEARHLLNRLATGTFRARLAEDAPEVHAPGSVLTLLTLIDPSGPEGTFALRHGNGLVPLTRLKLTLPETAQILAWARANTTDRFGPLRQVTPSLVFELAYDATRPNPRRKCGLDLIGARLLAWRQDLTPDRAHSLGDL